MCIENFEYVFCLTFMKGSLMGSLVFSKAAASKLFVHVNIF